MLAKIIQKSQKTNKPELKFETQMLKRAFFKQKKDQQILEKSKKVPKQAFSLPKSFKKSKNKQA